MNAPPRRRLSMLVGLGALLVLAAAVWRFTRPHEPPSPEHRTTMPIPQDAALPKNSPSPDEPLVRLAFDAAELARAFPARLSHRKRITDRSYRWGVSDGN